MPADRPKESSTSNGNSRDNTASGRPFQERCLNAAESFSERFLSIMDGLGEELYQMADQADDHELRRLYFTALQELYSRRQRLKGDFKKQFLAALKAEIQQQPDTKTASLFASAAISGTEQLPEEVSPQNEAVSEAQARDSSDNNSNEDKHTQMAKNLPKGSWIEFHSPDEPSLKARFTWVNPTSGVYLFVDRDGRKAPDKSPEELATAFRGGRATLIQSAAQLARATR